MKIISKIFLIIFFAFLVTPTIVTVIEKSADISIFYGISEEEHALKEIKAFLYTDYFSEVIVPVESSSSAILSENLSKQDKITSSIFIPPPNEV
ncbi:hypothetical protein DR871_015610 [Flavobacterium petrolei]|jgi:hypothetical protein|uniref:Uncharacterized protein n=1 Tax=Flavobacterium petrolei TaxID=2259594 RepID=A0A482TVR7_9FLAO|nr:hypothetical protein [Flavobacterium petrolei]MDD2674481.1 hypothetical protein [Flavobacterium sp.]RYJ50650.1 hypothetical protein DR871_015610 [Flavobacterium petrolei]